MYIYISISICRVTYVGILMGIYMDTLGSINGDVNADRNGDIDIRYDLVLKHMVD